MLSNEARNRIATLVNAALLRYGPEAVWLYLFEANKAINEGYHPSLTIHTTAEAACLAADAALRLNSGTIDPDCPSCEALKHGAAVRIWRVDSDWEHNSELLSQLIRVTSHHANVSRETVQSELRVAN